MWVVISVEWVGWEKMVVGIIVNDMGMIWERLKGNDILDMF